MPWTDARCSWAHRKSPVQPSQLHRRKRRPKKAPGDRYTVGSYAKAITRACQLAFRPPAPLGQRDDETKAQWQARLTDSEKAELKAWQRAHHWHPHQLRHTKATEIRKEAGLVEL